MRNRATATFFCDECGQDVSTGHVCPECKRVLCHKHYFGLARGPLKMKDGLCAKCAAKKR